MTEGSVANVPLRPESTPYSGPPRVGCTTRGSGSSGVVVDGETQAGGTDNPDPTPDCSGPVFRLPPPRGRGVSGPGSLHPHGKRNFPLFSSRGCRFVTYPLWFSCRRRRRTRGPLPTPHVSHSAPTIPRTHPPPTNNTYTQDTTHVSGSAETRVCAGGAPDKPSVVSLT